MLINLQKSSKSSFISVLSPEQSKLQAEMSSSAPPAGEEGRQGGGKKVRRKIIKFLISIRYVLINGSTFLNCTVSSKLGYFRSSSEYVL